MCVCGGGRAAARQRCRKSLWDCRIEGSCCLHRKQLHTDVFVPLHKTHMRTLPPRPRLGSPTWFLAVREACRLMPVEAASLMTATRLEPRRKASFSVTEEGGHTHAFA